MSWMQAKVGKGGNYFCGVAATKALPFERTNKPVAEQANRAASLMQQGCAHIFNAAGMNGAHTTPRTVPFLNKKGQPMKFNNQASSSSLLLRASAASAAIALGLGVASAQMAPTQPAPAPATPSAQAMPTANETMFKRIDADGNGSISKAELEKADANLARDFDRYDTDKDGKLSMTEFEAMLKAIRS